jgi:tetratricopeptide (TPR) repeat protein
LAIQQLRKTLELDPNFADSLPDLAVTLARVGKYEEAVVEANKGIVASGRSPQAIAALGEVYALTGRRNEARRVIADLQAMTKVRYVSPLDVAMVFALLDEKEAALSWLEKAYREHACWLIELEIEPSWDQLREDPRFADLQRRVGLPQ